MGIFLSAYGDGWLIRSNSGFLFSPVGILPLFYRWNFMVFVGKL
jgi:hypothetical protein